MTIIYAFMNIDKIYTVGDLKAAGVSDYVNDPLFCVKVVNAYLSPQTSILYAMHQDYSYECVAYWEPDIDETEAGHRVVKNLLNGNRGHWGPLEHPQLTFSIGFFPHSTMQQARTHRIASFDVQSFRYTSESILAAADDVTVDAMHINRAFYLRPLGAYTSRDGKRYDYTDNDRAEDIVWLRLGAKRYRDRFNRGFSEEHCRGLIGADYRQHWVYSANARSQLHFLDLRAKKDAAPEIRTLSELKALALRNWIPQVFDYYETHRFRKARLSP